MARLYFKYGAMGGGKTLDCIRTYYNYQEKGLVVRSYKPELDTRDSECIISSRTGDKIASEWIKQDDKIYELFKDFNRDNTDVILIDEAQFLGADQVQDLKDFAIDLDIPIICYGLTTDFRSYLFEGSKRLMELADSKEEIKSVCWCGKLATQNARIIDGEVVKEGEVVQVGGNESYTPLCYYHFREGKSKK